MIKLVASDLDGTIMGNDNNICENNIKAIEEINKKKINFAICTGKTYPIMKNVCSQFNATYGIFGNGNQIVNLKTGKEIYKNLLTKEETNTCISIAKKYNLHVHIYTNNEIITEKLEYMDLRNYKLKENKFYNISLDFKIVNNIQEYINSNDINIFKLVISSTKDISNVKNEILSLIDLNICRVTKYGEYKDNLINKEYEYIDIMPISISKNNALKVLSSHLNIKNEEIMAIGDNNNDLEMINEAGIGVAVANAYEQVKQKADYITKSSAENGAFAEAIYKFIDFK